MWSTVVRRGQRLRLVDTQGNAAVSALFYNAAQPLERYNMPDTLKAQQIACLKTGCAIYSDMGRVLCSVVADSLGWHDTITGHADSKASQLKYGLGTYQVMRNARIRNTRDNFLVELGKYGLGRRDIVANVNFFVKVAPDQDGSLHFVADHSKALDFIELRADMDTLVVLSNTPHPMDPSRTYNPPPVELQLRSGKPATSDDPVRNLCPENQRGFALNDRLYLTEAGQCH